MLGAIVMLVAIALFIIIHEAGHFVAARATGMKATEAFIGFGPRLWSTTRGDTEYGIKAIPFGGYVRILGMNPYEEVDPEDVGRTYRDKKFWQKSVVVLAGVVLNFAMGYLILFALLWSSGLIETTTTISGVTEDLGDGTQSPAAAAGLAEGDELLRIDGVGIESWEHATEVIAARPGSAIVIEIQRDGQLREVNVELAPTNPISGEQIGFLGVSPGIEEVSIGPFQAAGSAGLLFGQLVKESVLAIGRLVRPSSLIDLGGALFGDTEVPDDIRPVSPIGLAQIGAQVDRVGIEGLVFILASVNIILGLFNAVPLYPLDGGHFAVALYEKITKREADIRRLVPIAAAVIVLMVFLGAVAIVLDLTNPLSL